MDLMMIFGKSRLLESMIFGKSLVNPGPGREIVVLCSEQPIPGGVAKLPHPTIFDNH